MEGKQLTPVAAGFPGHRRSLDRPARSRVLAARSNRATAAHGALGDSELDGDIAADALVDGHLDDDVPVIVGQPLERLLHLPRPVDVLRRFLDEPRLVTELGTPWPCCTRPRQVGGKVVAIAEKNECRDPAAQSKRCWRSSQARQEGRARPPRRSGVGAGPKRRNGKCSRRRHRTRLPHVLGSGTLEPCNGGSAAKGSPAEGSARSRSPPFCPDQRLVQPPSRGRFATRMRQAWG